MATSLYYDSAKRHAEHLKEDLDQFLEVIKHNSDQLDNLRETVNKDDTVKELKEENERLREDYLRGWPISEAEDKKLKAWEKKHYKEEHGTKGDAPYRGAAGGSNKFEFFSCGLGVIGTVVCEQCKQKYEREFFKDLDDYFDTKRRLEFSKKYGSKYSYNFQDLG